MPAALALSTRARAWASHSLMSLQRWPWLDTWRTLRQRFREDRLGLTAGSLTFTTVISLVPLMTVMLALFTAFPMFASFQRALEKYFLQALVPDSIAKPVLASLTQFAGKASKVGSVGLALTLLAALALVFTIDRTLNSLWRVQRSRPLAQRVLVYWASITLGPLLLGVSLSLTSYALSASQGLVTALPGGVGLLFEVAEFLLLAGAAAGMFHFVPNTDVKWSHAWMGGIFVAVGLDLAKRGLTLYLKSVPSFSAIYGAFATVPIFLLWIYLSWVVVLLGAVIAAYAPSLSRHVRRLPDDPGARFNLALSLLRALAQARERRRPGLSLDDLATVAAVDRLQVEPVLEVLATLDWCGRLDEPGAKRHVLLAAPGNTPAAPLIHAFLLSPVNANQAFRERAGLDRLTLQDLLGPDTGPSPTAA